VKKLLLIVAVVAVAAPAAFGAAGAQTPAGACKAELTAIGEANFKSLYAPGGTGASAMGKCVSQHQRSAAANRVNASKACTAERAMAEADFKAAHNNESFNAFYGRNDSDQNAFGKCVSQKAQAADAAQEAATLKAAKACTTERGTTAESRAAFTAKYGGKAASAFGKCVSSKRKTA
jgi:hypothetical protein